jgi:flagellar basal-body rod protein FlgF
VLDAGGAPLVLDPQAGPPEAGADGTLHQSGQLIGAIGLFAFVPGPNATRYGNSGFLPDNQPQPVVDQPEVGVAQGFIEDSNVNPVNEMMRLIQVQRTFEQVTALMRDSDSAMKETIRAMGSR